MDRFFSFVALRPLPQVTAGIELASDTEFQQQLSEAASSREPQTAVVAAAVAFVAGQGFLGPSRADAVNLGEKLVELVATLQDGTDRAPTEVVDLVRTATGQLDPATRAEDEKRARDSVLAAYLASISAEEARVATSLARAYALAYMATAEDVPLADVAALVHAPFVVPAAFLGPKPTVEADGVDTEQQVHDLLDRFTATVDRRERLGRAIAELDSHEEDELNLNEAGQSVLLADLYRVEPVRDHVREDATVRDRAIKLATDGRTQQSSPFRRAAARSNVFLSRSALEIMSDNTRQTLGELALDPAASSMQTLRQRTLSEFADATRQVRDLTIDLGSKITIVSAGLGAKIGAVIGNYRLDPVDEPPAAAEPVTAAVPKTHTPVQPLGVADLLVVRTHLMRYDRTDVAALENVIGGEKLTHRSSRIDETETTTTTESERSSVQALAQTTADQDTGKTTAQAIGTGRGPLTSDGPASFARTVTDQVSATVSSRTRNISTERQLRRTEDAIEHVFDRSAEQDAAFGVYQRLDGVYEAQIYSYGTRLLYDVIVPEPAALYREAVARARGGAPLAAKPARFTTPVDKLSGFNWAYYATGHQAQGVEPPPQATIVVTEPFAGKATDPFGGELNANTLEFAEARSSKLPKGYKAASYRIRVETSGWTPYALRVTVGSKQIWLDGAFGSVYRNGKLDGEIDTIPVALMADGNGRDPGLSTITAAIEILCEPTDDTVAAWQVKTHAAILAGNQRRIADWEEQAAARDATAQLHLRSLTAARKTEIVQTELKRATLSLLTGQSFAGFSANSFDSLGFPYPNAAATGVISAYVRFFEQAIEWEHIESAFFPYFWGSRSSWVSKILGQETDQRFAAFLRSGAARVVLPVRQDYERAFEKFLATGAIPTTSELLDAGGPLWVSLITQLREGAGDSEEQAVGDPWEFRLATDLVRARRDDLLPQWTRSGTDWVEQPDPRY